jgi:hypothetical protein
MRRIRTELRGWAPRLLACSVLLGAPLADRTACAQESAGDAQRALAREHFAKGVALAKTHAYAEALTEFEQAYAAVPHFSVLYNIGQARLALGQSAAAVTTLQRYLDEGGATIDAKRRAEVEATLSRERQRLPAPEPVVSGEAVVPVTAPVGGIPAPVTAPVGGIPAPVTAPVGGIPAPAPAPSTPILAASGPPKATSPRVDRAPRAPNRSASRVPRTLAYAVGATGVVLSGGALAHYLWNRGRYQDWQSKYATYYRDPTEPNRALAVGAGVALGTGGVLWLASAPGSDPRRGGFDPFITAQGTF